MKIIDWLFRPPKFRRFEDSYAIDVSAQLEGLKLAIARQQSEENAIWIVVHFTDTFLSLQSFLERSGIEFWVAQQTSDLLDRLAAQLPSDNEELKAPDVVLVMASLLTEPSAGFEVSNLAKQPPVTAKVAIMVCERHPLPTMDQAIVQFARSLPVTISLGYLLTLDDCVVRQVISPVTRTVLNDLGMNNRELVASNFVTRRLDKVLARQSQNYVERPQLADNAEQWMQVNRKV